MGAFINLGKDFNFGFDVSNKVNNSLLDTTVGTLIALILF